MRFSSPSTIGGAGPRRVALLLVELDRGQPRHSSPPVASVADTGRGLRRSSESVAPPARAIADGPVGARAASPRAPPAVVPARAPGRCLLERRVDDRDRAQRRRRAHVERGIPRDRPQVDRADDDIAPLVEAGEGEEVLDEEAHADGLLLDAVHRLVDVVVAGDRAHPVQLGVAAHRHERRAQLVARVADEPAHLAHGGVALRERGVDAIEHRVDRAS